VNFIPGAVVNWNGSARSTALVSPAELQAQIAASDVATAGKSALITVTNPPPGGGAFQFKRRNGRDSPAHHKHIGDPASLLSGRARAFVFFSADINGG